MRPRLKLVSWLTLAYFALSLIALRAEGPAAWLSALIVSGMVWLILFIVYNLAWIAFDMISRSVKNA